MFNRVHCDCTLRPRLLLAWRWAASTGAGDCTWGTGFSCVDEPPRLVGANKRGERSHRVLALCVDAYPSPLPTPQH